MTLAVISSLRELLLTHAKLLFHSSPVLLRGTSNYIRIKKEIKHEMTRSLFPFFSRLTRHSLTFPACFCRSFSCRSMPSTPVGSEPGAASPRNTATLVTGQSRSTTRSYEWWRRRTDGKSEAKISRPEITEGEEFMGGTVGHRQGAIEAFWLHCGRPLFYCPKFKTEICANWRFVPNFGAGTKIYYLYIFFPCLYAKLR